MKIALLGYGKMGKAIQEAAVKQGHQIALVLRSSNVEELTKPNLQLADVAIEVSTPATAVDHILACFEAGIPVICGTTGWLDRMEEIRSACKAGNHGFLYASNFSIGVNIFFRINQLLGELMASRPEYFPGMEEVHHLAKKDAPSGTAITLARQILEKVDRLKGWSKGPSQDPTQLPVISKREGNVPGTHRVTWQSGADQIQIMHTAISRAGFAEGAILAAEWIRGRAGEFDMSDVLGW